MRPLPALLVAMAVLAGEAGLPACSDARKCTANADCPAQNYCVPADAGVAGICRQDCQATADCRDPARRCNSLGRCVPVEIPLWDAGTDAAALSDAGSADDAAADDGAPADDAAADDGAPADDATTDDGAPADDATTDDGAPADDAPGPE